jgi:threonine aldolase
VEKIIDLRSDTVTRPTERMRDAMRDALVGDSVLGDDPTVIRLEEMASDMFGKQAALFLASGTMANQAAVLSFCRRGDQIVLHDRSHLYNLEVGGLASTCGVQTRTLQAPGGRYDLQRLEQEIHSADIQKAPTTLICMENTFDLNRGLAVPPDHFKDVRQLADRYNIPVYLDGARVLNAAVALNLQVSELCADVDAVGLCLSKGLGCPIGSLLMGSQEFIARTVRMRQRLGGGWRQAGILAAAGIVGLTEMVDRLADDHSNAHRMAARLLELGLGIDLDQVQTNIIHINLPQLATQFCESLLAQGVHVKNIGPNQVRMVTHKDFSSAEIEQVLSAVKTCL